MGDRNNPIKFGPEWLRNLARERRAGSSSSVTSGVANSSGTSGVSGGTIATNAGAPGASGGATANSSGTLGASGGTTATSSNAAAMMNTASSTNTIPKVQLAKLRYGREEMLALYDRTTDAPSELKYLEVLYQPRGKLPYALNNTFEDEMRENMRSGPPIGGMSSVERFGVGRGMGRGMNVSDGRGRPRALFTRQPSTGRGSPWHLSNPRMPGYGNGPEDDSSLTLRSWSNSNGGNMNNRNGSEQSERTSTKMFRSKRQGNNTNWRQPQSRDDGEEWRLPDPTRSRSNPDKWERDWGNDRQDKQWNSNRRTWVAGDTQNNDDNIPEWAVDSAEACGGTFDSSGAFHGYSNDDSTLLKNQESAYPLTRSHTHGSFVRSKTMEEGSEEWWASEKAKKLSPKRFDASDIKFKKQSSTGIPEVSANPTSTSKSNKEDIPLQEAQDDLDVPATVSEPPENNSSGLEDNGFNKKNAFKPKFTESKTFDALMRSDVNLEEANDERGNFQSVMITPNNSLRQKHQNIVSAINDDPNRQGRKPGVMLLNPENELGKHQSTEDKIVEEIFDMTLEDKEHLLSKLPGPSGNPMMNPSSSGIVSGMATVVNSMAQVQNPGMQLRNPSPTLSNQGLTMNAKPNLPTPGIQGSGIPTAGLQTIGITNSALNASLGLPLGPGNNTMGMPLQGVPPPVMPNPGNSTISPGTMQPGAAGIAGFQTGSSISGISGPNVANNSLFLGQNLNNGTVQLPSSNDMQLSNHAGQTNIFPMHGLQHSQTPFGSSIYSNIIQQSQPQPASTNQNLADQWFYEDPNKNIQGPFTSKDMYNWYRAGFFTPSLMVRRACDVCMRPLGSYGPMVPFAQMNMLTPFSLSGGFESRTQGPHESMLNSQQGLGLDVINPMSNVSDNTMDTLQFGTVGLIRNPPFGQQQMVDSLWSQPSSSADLMWMQQAMNTRNETHVNNLPMFFWDQQPSAITSNSLLPEEIAKEMKTEDQILAQLRASQNINTQQNIPFINDQPVVSTASSSKPEDTTSTTPSGTPNMEELEKLIQKDTLTSNSTNSNEPPVENQEVQPKIETVTKIEQSIVESENKSSQPSQNKTATETKPAKRPKSEIEKTSKIKEVNNTKNKSKKPKEEKKDEPAQVKLKEDDNNKVEQKKSEESSPAKIKKDEKTNKKALDKLTKDWLKDRGYTIVKVSDKNASKDSKKKADEAKAVEEAERKRKEEEKLAAEEEKKRKQAEALKKQQEQHQLQQQRQAAESVIKKAPWSAVANQAMQATNKDGPTLAEIQRLEREKKLEQMKEQQQMMQIIAQQQAAALAREQEMQAGLGWAKKKGTNLNLPGQSLAEIQAEARKQAAAAAQAVEEVQPAPPPQTNHVPWGNSQNGGGFWDTQPSQPAKPVEKPQDLPKVAEQNKTKKKITVTLPTKKETTPAIEFESWCTTVLTSWSSKIDVPTFVGFLKDIESPYEVKDYVKCYLGESKDSNDFARQFLERRSKLLRVGMVTPSDDLCSPAVAVNPRTTSNSDYQEVKGKGKKTKKNKMLKVDARILGFSVTAAEDRINVGDIDTV